MIIDILISVEYYQKVIYNEHVSKWHVNFP